MIHNDIANQLQLLIKAVAPPLIEVTDTPLESPEWIPGQRVQAHVLASLPNGRFQVLVSDHELDMNLPRNTQPGEKLELTFVSAQPRPTFVLTRDMPLPQGMPSEAKLSEAARFLGDLLRGAEPAAAQKQQVPLAMRSTPLLPVPPTRTEIPELARQLGKAIVQSGLFYESHQVEWVSGQRPLAELLQEPQGKLSPRVAVHSLPQQAERAARLALPEQNQETASKTQLAATNTPERLVVREQPVHPQAAGLVQQQLEVLDGRQIFWQGQIWPGQTMQWQVEEREGRGGNGEEETSGEWHTSLRLHLPRLGSVDAALSLTARGVQLRLNAAESSAANVMQNRQEELRQSMEASGLKLLSFAVEVGNGQT